MPLPPVQRPRPSAVDAETGTLGPMTETTSSAATGPGPGPRDGTPARRRRRVEPRHLAYVALLVVVGVCVYALTQHYSDPDTTVQGGAVERVIPAAESKILQQDQVGIDLVTGYEAQLTVNGTPLPADEVTAMPELGQVAYQPGQGRTFEHWPAGRNCVVATFWPIATGPQQSDSRTWCFTVL